jgi:hypothetical protein
MTTNTAVTKTKRSFGVLGVGAAACAACCAGPILGFIAATGIVTATGFALFGIIGLAIAIPGIVLIAQRRTRPSTCTRPTEPVAVSSPARRT